MQTERVTILMTPSAKASLAARAASRHMSIGQYVRRKIEEEDELTPEEEAELALLVAQVNEAVPKMEASLDGMIRTVQETHREMDQLLRQMGARE